MKSIGLFDKPDFEDLMPITAVQMQGYSPYNFLSFLDLTPDNRILNFYNCLQEDFSEIKYI